MSHLMRTAGMMGVVTAMLKNNRSGPGRAKPSCRIIDNEAAERLAIAIVKQAADDYENMLRKMLRHPSPEAMRKLKQEKAENEKFFLSPWFGMLVSQTDGRALMAQIQKNAASKEKQRLEKKVKKAREKMAKRMQKGE